MRRVTQDRVFIDLIRFHKKIWILGVWRRHQIFAAGLRRGLRRIIPYWFNKRIWIFGVWRRCQVLAPLNAYAGLRQTLQNSLMCRSWKNDLFLLTRGLRRLELGGLLWAPAGLSLALDLLTRMVTRKLIDKKLIINSIVNQFISLINVLN